MKKKNSKISFYVDMMVVETMLSNNNLYKFAQSTSTFDSIRTWIEGYVKEHIDENDKVGSLVNFIMPAIIDGLIGGPLGFLAGILMSVFDIDSMGILRSIYAEIKGLLSEESKSISSDQIDNIVNTSIDKVAPDDPLVPKVSSIKQYEILKANSYSKDLRQAKLFKLAAIEYKKNPQLLSVGGIATSAAEAAAKAAGIGSKAAGKNILRRIFSYIFKTVLKAAGFMVAADVVNEGLGRPSAFTPGSLQKQREERGSGSSASTQNKFKKNPSYSDEQLNSVHITNNKENIEQMVIDFAKEVYQGLEDQDNNIRSCNNFNVLVENIVWYNRKSIGDPVVFIPLQFNSKKKMADTFIAQLAQKVS